MPTIKRDGNIISIGDDIRIESGPRRVEAVATEELLANEVTAEHYVVGGKDALGKEIVLGEPMTYLDWIGFKAGLTESTSHYLYRYVDREDPEDFEDAQVWAGLGAYDTEDDALSAATEL